MAAGLLGDTGTRIFFQQAPDQVADAKELLGLTDNEAGYLAKLVRGRALWRVREHAAIVHLVLSPREVADLFVDFGEQRPHEPRPVRHR